MDHPEILVPQDLGVHDPLHPLEFPGIHRCKVGEVEAEQLRRDEGARLADMFAEHADQGLVEQVSRRVMAPDRGAALHVDPRRHGVPHGDGAGDDPPPVDRERSRGDHRVLHDDPP